MRITGIRTVPVSVGVDRRVGKVDDQKGFRFTSRLLVILIETDEDLVGVGEVNGSPDWSGELQQGAMALVEEHLAPRLLNEDPCRVRYCMSKLASTFANPFVKAGVEMALFDLLGKKLQTPLYQLLGGKVRSGSLPLRFPLMPVSPEKSAAAAAQIAAEGCGTIKLKVGRDPLEFDLERVRRVREAVGDAVRVTVDANGAWSVNDAIQASHRLEEYDVSFVEQPVNRFDLDGLAEVRRRTTLPVMADESVFTVRDAWECIQKRAADIISVYPGKNGGILETIAIATMAESAGVHCAIGSNLEWDISSAANAHVAVALPNIVVERYATDIIGPVFHTDSALVTPLQVEGWRLTVPEQPGLGVVLEASRLEQMSARQDRHSGQESCDERRGGTR